MTESLTASPAAFAVFADMLPQLVWSARPDGFVDYFNRRWYDYMGTTSDAVKAEDWDSLMHPDDLEGYTERWNSALATGDAYEVQYRFRRASDQTYRWFLGRAEPIMNEDGQVVRWFGTCTDIDAQKQAEMKLAHLSERERSISEALQGAVQPLLPDGLPGLDLAWFYKAGLAEASVGGDFSDVFPLENGTYCLVVGDLSGKGLAAAAQVATVRNMLRYAVYTEKSLAEAVTRLNQILLQYHLLSGFATLVVCTFDAHRKTLTYVSCGQEPALLRRTVRGEVQEMPPTGPVLGMDEAADYQDQVISVGSGDVFALYTDGLTESGTDRLHTLGVPGLAALMAGESQNAAQVMARMVTGSEAHGNGSFRDDVCLIVGIVQPNIDPQALSSSQFF